jgi:hypothetical protein
VSIIVAEIWTLHFAAIGGTTGALVEQNKQVLGLIEENLAAFGALNLMQVNHDVCCSWNNLIQLAVHENNPLLVRLTQFLTCLCPLNDFPPFMILLSYFCETVNCQQH